MFEAKRRDKGRVAVTTAETDRETS